MDKRNWCITFGVEPEWVTEDDKNYYLNSIRQGMDYIIMHDGRVFSPRFIKISSREHMEANKHLEAGEWQCPKGTWHRKGADCVCEDHYTFKDGTAKLLE